MSKKIEYCFCNFPFYGNWIWFARANEDNSPHEYTAKRCDNCKAPTFTFKNSRKYGFKRAITDYK